jgi:hypothetical protein
MARRAGVAPGVDSSGGTPLELAAAAGGATGLTGAIRPLQFG